MSSRRFRSCSSDQSSSETAVAPEFAQFLNQGFFRGIELGKTPPLNGDEGTVTCLVEPLSHLELRRTHLCGESKGFGNHNCVTKDSLHFGRECAEGLGLLCHLSTLPFYRRRAAFRRGRRA